MRNFAKFVISKKVVADQYKKAESLADAVSYSLKTNYEVGQLLEQVTDTHFSVHSLDAANLVKDKSRIWFFAQAWDEQEITTLLQKGITSFVVDNKKDLELLLKHNTSKKINLLLRMRLKENTIHTGKHFVFGFYAKEINNLIPKIKENKTIDKLGIHFHRKTQNISDWSLKEDLQDVIQEETLQVIDILNIGGGIPSKYKNHKAGTVAYILKKIAEVRTWLNSKNIKVIIEPGRFIAAPAVKLVTEIKNIYKDNIIINCSVYNAAMDTFVSHIRLLVEGETDTRENAFTIKGCTPDSLDIFRYRIAFKNKPKIGDTITFLNAGAYNFSTEFCQLKKLKTEVVE